jgi:hypothetical protein
VREASGARHLRVRRAALESVRGHTVEQISGGTERFAHRERLFRRDTYIDSIES